MTTMAGKKRCFLIVVGLFVLLGVDVSWCAEREVTLHGSYQWNMGGEGSLEVTFLPAESEGWEVSFSFDHAGKFHSYQGMAIGELGSGELEGQADSGRGTRYRFLGAFENGVFTGEHYAVSRSGRQQQTGTLTFEFEAGGERE